MTYDINGDHTCISININMLIHVSFTKVLCTEWTNIINILSY